MGKMEFWRDEVGNITTGMHVRSWFVDSQMTQPARDVERAAPGMVVMGIETRRNDGKIRLTLVSDRLPIEVEHTGWMDPTYPVFMGARSSLVDWFLWRWSHIVSIVSRLWNSFVQKVGSR